MSSPDTKLTRAGTPGKDVAAFLAKMKAAPKPQDGSSGRLIFALDATMSRQPAWDQACRIQSDMFAEAAKAGGLRIQLVSFRGFGEFDVRPWTADAASLAKIMDGYGVRGGHTQIERVLKHAAEETKAHKVNALVYVGDAIEESVDAISAAAGVLGLAGVPAFMFHEGRDPAAEAAFREVARITGGAYCRFDSGSAAHLRELLKAVAVFAAGGRRALANHARTAGGAALLLANQMQGR